MQAIVYSAYGPPDVLRLGEVAMPVPQEGEVLVQIHAAGVNAADWHLMRGEPRLMRLAMGLRAPRNPRLGADVAGVVAAVGPGVTQFKPGDAVFGDISGAGMGAFAEYVAVPAAVLAPMPSNLSFEQAAVIPLAAVTALQALRIKQPLAAGQKVAINGASGGVGAYVVQIAKALGAEVTAVCSTRNVEMVRALGADHVIDYTREDFTQQGQHYDRVVAVNGYHPIRHYKQVLNPGGIYVMAGGGNKQMFEAMLVGPLRALGSGKTLTSLLAHPNAADLDFVRGLAEAGQVMPMIDRCYPLAQVADAIRHMENAHARGKIVITVISKAAQEAPHAA